MVGWCFVRQMPTSLGLLCRLTSGCVRDEVPAHCSRHTTCNAERIQLPGHKRVVSRSRMALTSKRNIIGQMSVGCPVRVHACRKHEQCGITALAMEVDENLKAMSQSAEIRMLRSGHKISDKQGASCGMSSSRVPRRATQL